MLLQGLRRTGEERHHVLRRGEPVLESGEGLRETPGALQEEPAGVGAQRVQDAADAPQDLRHAAVGQRRRHEGHDLPVGQLVGLQELKGVRADELASAVGEVEPLQERPEPPVSPLRVGRCDRLPKLKEGERRRPSPLRNLLFEWAVLKRLDLRLPEPVLVAVLARCGARLRAVEGSLRLLARLQEAAADALAVDDLDPLDVVVRLHGMGRAAHLDVLARTDGHVLFLGRVRGVLRHDLHGLPAARQRAAAHVKHLHHVAALRALANVQQFHDIFPPS